MSPSGLRAVRLAVFLACAVSTARAQLIPIKTIPFAQGGQFQVFPSNNLGLGAVTIALPDSLGDPFANPATAARLRGARLFSAPTVYSVSGNAGGGRSLPFALLARRADWYGGLALVLQQVDPSRPPQQRGVIVEPVFGGPIPLPSGGQIPGPDLRAHGNEYAFGMIGRSWQDGNLSVGASALWTGLHALDGVDLLYSDSRRVEQTGHAIDLRVGALKQWVRDDRVRALEAIVVHNRFAATHNVLYADQIWDPGLQQLVFQPRTEQNFDHTNTWGAQLKYSMPLMTPGWNIGWILTANLATHPKLPNYQISNVAVIPWDPGRTHAYDLGVGFSKVLGPSTFGVDAIYEPIHSYTWADAMVPTSTVNGDTIPLGGKTVENRFKFSNAVFRIGVGRDVDLEGTNKALGFQFGFMVRSINYGLRQADHVQATLRELHTGWYEWTPTWGLTLRFPEFELRYRGRVTKGAGRPGTQFIAVGARDLAVSGAAILAAPSGPLNLIDVNTSTHQISLSLPLH